MLCHTSQKGTEMRSCKKVCVCRPWPSFPATPQSQPHLKAMPLVSPSFGPGIPACLPLILGSPGLRILIPEDVDRYMLCRQKAPTHHHQHGLFIVTSATTCFDAASPRRDAAPSYRRVFHAMMIRLPHAFQQRLNVASAPRRRHRRLSFVFRLMRLTRSTRRARVVLFLRHAVSKRYSAFEERFFAMLYYMLMIEDMSPRTQNELADMTRTRAMLPYCHYMPPMPRVLKYIYC